MVLLASIRHTFITYRSARKPLIRLKIMQTDKTSCKHSFKTVFLIFLRLGLTSFGGPVAHFGYFRTEFVTTRKWLTDRHFADLIALCQFLPGPASSQLGMAIGLYQAGFAGALAAWAGFTLPSAVIMITFAGGLHNWGYLIAPGTMHGIETVAVAVVINAVWGMILSFCRDAKRVSMMLCAAGAVYLLSTSWMPILTIAFAGFLGIAFYRSHALPPDTPLRSAIRRRTGAALLILFVLLLLITPALYPLFPMQIVWLTGAFYRAGSLVFGGGHVVLPLLEAVTVSNGLIDRGTFLVGYGLAQAVPGPLFSFAAFLGATVTTGLPFWAGGLICLVALFLPSFLLIAGCLPFWDVLSRNRFVQSAMFGINAAVTGLLLSALVAAAQSVVRENFLTDAVLILTSLVALMYWRWPPWLLIIAGGLAGWLAGSV